MVVIDTRTDTAHCTLSKTEAASLIGVDRSTIHRWIVKGEKQEFNHFIIYVKVERHKQRKGFAGTYRPPGYRRQ